MGRAIVVAAVLFGAATGAMAQAKFIPPTVDLALPPITFDTNINPIPGVLSADAQNIIRAHRVALQQVQAAIRYLQVHRSDILAGKNGYYNQTFGDFYDPNSQFAGLYNRTLQHNTGRIDRFGNPVFETYYNTSHYDRVLFVFQQIQQALQNAIRYAWGAQTALPATQNSTDFDTYRQSMQILNNPNNPNAGTLVGDPLFGSPNVPDNINQPPIDPVTGLPVVDPTTGLPFVNSPLRGSGGFDNQAFNLPTNDTRGFLQWGDSTSFTPKHITQIGTPGSTALTWDNDNDISKPAVPLTKAQELAFFKDRLDAFAVTPVVGANGRPETVYVGGAFLNESQRSGSNPDGTPNPFFIPTNLNQYQMIIAALAQSDGSLARIDPLTGLPVPGSAVAIEPGLHALFGDSAYFFAALDTQSYANFADVFNPDGFGDGSLLPPPGKNGTTISTFIPFVPGS